MRVLREGGRLEQAAPERRRRQPLQLLVLLQAPELDVEGGVSHIIAEAAEDMLKIKWATRKLTAKNCHHDAQVTGTAHACCAQAMLIINDYEFCSETPTSVGATGSATTSHRNKNLHRQTENKNQHHQT